MAIDPLTLFPTPQPGDRVYLYATYKATVNGMVQVTQIFSGSYTVYSRGESVEPFRSDVSSSDLVLEVGNYESTLISFSGTVASDFASAGTGHVSANVVSLGNPTVSSSLKLRLTSSVQSALDVTQGCSVTTNAPLWRFNTQAQPSAWTSADLTVLSCPAPRVLGASSTSGTAVVVAFDRRIDPATVSASGSQFTFDNGLVATSATVTDRLVRLTTSSQVEGTSYRVTVAPSVLDSRGSAIDGSANSASFTGYTSTPTPGIAQLRISEVSPGILNGRDLVELIAIRGGSVDGFSLTMGATVMATFPNVQVAAGDVIVVHIKPDTTTNGDATDSETLSKSQFPAGTYSANYDTAWDFLGSLATEIGYSRRVLRVRDATGAVQDGLAPVTWLSRTLCDRPRRRPDALGRDPASSRPIGLRPPVACERCPRSGSQIPDSVWLPPCALVLQAGMELGRKERACRIGARGLRSDPCRAPARRGPRPWPHGTRCS